MSKSIGVKAFNIDQLKPKESLLVIGNKKYYKNILKDFKYTSNLVLSSLPDIDIETDYILLLEQTSESVIEMFYKKYGHHCCDNLEIFKDIFSTCTKSAGNGLLLKTYGKNKVFCYEAEN